MHRASRAATAALLIAALGGACGSAPPTASAKPAAFAGGASASGSTAPTSTTAAAASRPPVLAAARSTTTTWKGRTLGGIKEAPPPPPGYTGLDAFDRRAHLPPGAVPVVKGKDDTVEWRLYVYRDDKEHTCLHFAEQGALDANGVGSGGATATCYQRPPLDRSTFTSAPTTWMFGLTAPTVVKVRVEHQDGTSETYDTVSAPSYTEHFYAGELSVVPITAIVGLDAGGRVVAERTDNDSLNRNP